MEKIFAPEEARELIRGWLVHARKKWKKHGEAARRLESQYRKVGIASVILSAIVGASTLGSLEVAYEPWGRIVAGMLSIAASVLSSLLTFQKYEERTEKHRKASAEHKGGAENTRALACFSQGLDSRSEHHREIGVAVFGVQSRPGCS